MRKQFNHAKKKLMYQVRKKRVGGINYRTIKAFKSYDKAYSYLGDYLQEEHNLHWSFSVKYLMYGYDNKKLFKYGSTYVRRNQICYKIVECNKPKSKNN